jgi:hypothetical protein
MERVRGWMEGGREGGREEGGREGGRENPKDADGRLLHVPIQTQPEDYHVDYLALAQVRQIPYMYVCMYIRTYIHVTS